MPSESADTHRDIIEHAVEALEAGKTVIYPTETVYGLGADSRRPEAVSRVFEQKNRDPNNPLSVALPSVSAVESVAEPTDRVHDCMQTFLPGPVTVITEVNDTIASAVTADRTRVGIRIPDHELSLKFLRAAAPIPVTATSANLSGAQSAQTISAIDKRLRRSTEVIIDDGVTGGAESTVVDPDKNNHLSKGANAEAVIDWLTRVTGSAPTVT